MLRGYISKLLFKNRIPKFILIYQCLPVDLCLGTDADIFEDFFFATGDLNLVVPILQLIEVIDVLVVSRCDHLGEIDVVLFFNGNGDVTTDRIGDDDAEFHVVLIRLRDMDLQVWGCHGVQHTIDFFYRMDNGMEALCL